MNNQYLIDFYKIAFLSIKQKVTCGKANLAKPVLILSVFDGIESGMITRNRIQYNVVKPLYEAKLREFQNEPTPIKYPFYHIKSDGFWKLEWKADSPAVPAAPSDKFLRVNLAYAMLDNALWDILQEKEVRGFYKAAIIDYYNMK